MLGSGAGSGRSGEGEGLGELGGGDGAGSEGCRGLVWEKALGYRAGSLLSQYPQHVDPTINSSPESLWRIL